jgi:hypothetical protein
MKVFIAGLRRKPACSLQRVVLSCLRQPEYIKVFLE